jgi:hypothetical protein
MLRPGGVTRDTRRTEKEASAHAPLPTAVMTSSAEPTPHSDSRAQRLHPWRRCDNSRHIKLVTGMPINSNARFRVGKTLRFTISYQRDRRVISPTWVKFPKSGIVFTAYAYCSYYVEFSDLASGPSEKDMAFSKSHLQTGKSAGRDPT